MWFDPTVPSKSQIRWICGPLAAGSLLPLVSLTQASIGLPQAKADVVVTQKLSEQEVQLLVQQANQLKQPRSPMVTKEENLCAATEILVPFSAGNHCAQNSGME